MKMKKLLVAVLAAAPAIAMAQGMSLESGDLGAEAGVIEGIAGAGGACVGVAADDADTIYVGFAEGEAVDAAAVMAKAAAGGYSSCSAALAPVAGSPALLAAPWSAPMVLGGILGLGTVALVLEGGGSAVTPIATSPAQ